MRRQRQAVRSHAQADRVERQDVELAKEVGVVAGDRVKVSSNRGHIVAVALVTKRIKPLMIEGKKVQTVGLPLHWGFKGLTKPGYLINTLTPSVGDGNSQTPEF